MEGQIISFVTGFKTPILKVVTRWGECNMFLTAKENVRWPDLYKDINQIVVNCDVCLSMHDKPKRTDFSSWPQAIFHLKEYILIMRNGEHNVYLFVRMCTLN